VPLGLAALVDDRLSSAERSVVADRFMGTKPCCVPPGFARKLREQEVDVRSPGFQQFLTAWLWSVSISIADIERRHSRNRRFVDSTGSHNGGGASWEQFAASYINREASSLRLNQIRDFQQAREDVADSADRPLIACDARVEKTPKAMSALELFRKDLFLELRAADAIINPCSKAAWDLVRREWADLDQQKRILYEDLAAATRDHCRTLRALRASRAQAAVQDHCMQDVIAIEDGDANGPGQDHAVLVAALATRPASFSSSVVLVGVDNGAGSSDPLAFANMHDMHAAVVKEVEQRGEDDIFPITQSKLRSVIAESPGCIYSTVRKLTAQFCCVQPHRGVFNADYAMRCEGFCKRSTPSEAQDMCSELLALLARWFPNKGDIVKSDPLVVIEVYGPEGRLCRRRFAMLFGCSSQSGRNRALQQFAILSPQCAGRLSTVYAAMTV
jgi:hypothetical protein